MIELIEADFLGVCLEGFFYGKLSVLRLCTETCTFPKLLFPGIGLYSGIFVMYIQCKPDKSRTSTILFYTLCLLYVLSTATIVADLVALILQVSNNSICKNIIFYHLYSGVSLHHCSNFK